MVTGSLVARLRARVALRAVNGRQASDAVVGQAVTRAEEVRTSSTAATAVAVQLEIVQVAMRKSNTLVVRLACCRARRG